MAPRSGMVDAFLQCALEMWKGLCAAPKPHFFAKVITAFTADAALTARDAYFKCYAVTQVEAVDLWPDGNHDTRRLVAQRQRLTSAKVAISKFLII